MKKIIILLFIILFSCDEESVTEVKKDKEEKVNSVLNFKVPYDLYPEYTFWGHSFKLTLDFDDTLDITKLKYFFNGYEIKAYEVSKTETQFIQLFVTPLDAYTDSLEIRQYYGKDSAVFFTRKFDVVNTEIEIDSVNYPLCYNNSTVSGKGMKYAKHLYLVSQYFTGGEFRVDYSYNNNASGSGGTGGETVDDNTARFVFKNAYQFGFRIAANDPITGQTHTYPYLLTSGYSYCDVDNPKILKHLVKNRTMEIEFKAWTKLNKNDILKINDKVIENKDIKFYRSQQHWFEGNLESYNGRLIFNFENLLKSNKLEIDFECGNDTTLYIELGTEYKSASIVLNLGQAFYKVDEKSLTGTDYSDYFSINMDNLKSSFNHPVDYVSYSSESRNGFSESRFKKFKLYYVKDNSIKFQYTDNYNSSNSSNYQGSSSDKVNIDYEGICQISDLGNSIVVRIEKSQFVNLNVKRDIYSSVEHVGSVPNKYVVFLDKIEYDDDAFIEIVFEKW